MWTGARGWGIRRLNPGGGWGRQRGHVAVICFRAQESCSFLFPVLGSLEASLLARGSKWGGGDRPCGFMWSGSGEKPAGAARQAGAQAEVSGSAGSWCRIGPSHAHPFLAGGSGLPLPLRFLSSWLVEPGIDFKTASLVVKSRQGVHSLVQSQCPPPWVQGQLLYNLGPAPHLPS